MTQAFTVEMDVDRQARPEVEIRTGIQSQTWSEIDDRGQPGTLASIYYISELDPEMPGLRAPLKVQLAVSDEGLLEADAPALGLSGVGASVPDAIKDLADTIAGLWNEFTETPTEQLHTSALEMLARLRRFLADRR
jgi:hypothetical protein